MANRYAIFFAVLFFFVRYPTQALADEWRIREVAGVVRVAIPARPAANGSVGQVLPTGTSVTTGGNGRAMITNGQQRVVVGPNSRTTLAPEVGGMTRVLQDLGSALFQVDRQRQPHFRVETPLLAAVVKGTTFTVTVDPMGDRVHVAEGLVEVRANNGNAVSDVAAGATALVPRQQPTSVEVSTPAAAVPTEAAPVAAPNLDYEALTDGLVQNPPATAPAATSGTTATSSSPIAVTATTSAQTASTSSGNSAATSTGSGASSAQGGNGSAPPVATGSGANGSVGTGNGNPGSPGGGVANGGAGNGSSGNPGNGGNAGNPGNPGNGGGDGGSGNGGGNGGNPGNPGNPGNGGSGNGGGNGGNSGNPGNPGNGGGNGGSGNG
ncbi:FecR family protein, partial [Brevundimonas sp. MEB006b]|uniref:FecR domain-containing protein n=1 Tax=Brevundimonas sp. MEB006b TaxID=3040283 RepID=UPI00254E73C5